MQSRTSSHSEDNIGSSNSCKKCLQITQSDWAERNKEELKLKRQKWYSDNREDILERTKVSRLKSVYGMTPDDIRTAKARQNNACLICSVSFEECDPVVDHCHASKVVRGLLCSLCNSGLGMFRDNTSFLLRAVAYLKRTYGDLEEGQVNHEQCETPPTHGCAGEEEDSSMVGLSEVFS